MANPFSLRIGGNVPLHCHFILTHLVPWVLVLFLDHPGVMGNGLEIGNTRNNNRASEVELSYKGLQFL